MSPCRRRGTLTLALTLTPGGVQVIYRLDRKTLQRALPSMLHSLGKRKYNKAPSLGPQTPNLSANP